MCVCVCIPHQQLPSQHRCAYMILKTEVPPVNMNAAVHHASRRAQKKFAENIQKKKIYAFSCVHPLIDRKLPHAQNERHQMIVGDR